MKKKIYLVLIILLISFFYCHKSEENKKIISEVRGKHTFMQEFLNKHPEENLLLVMNFINEPEIYFEKIKKIPQLFSYFEVLEHLAVEDEKFRNFWYGNFLIQNFQKKKITLRKIEILTFLLLNADGTAGEIVADNYTKLFSKSSDIFIIYLSERSDWKRIIDLLEVGDWQVFKASVEKLEDSGFEGEFKRYVLAPIDKEGKRIIK